MYLNVNAPTIRLYKVVVYIYSKIQLIIFTISNITLAVWLLYGFIKLNSFLKSVLDIKNK